MNLRIIPLAINNTAGTATLTVAPGVSFRIQTFHLTVITSAGVADRSISLRVTTTGTTLCVFPMTKAIAANTELDVTWCDRAGGESYWISAALIGIVATGGVGHICPPDVRVQAILDGLQAGDVLQTGWAVIEYVE